jgi:hypothetical protein
MWEGKSHNARIEKKIGEKDVETTVVAPGHKKSEQRMRCARARGGEFPRDAKTLVRALRYCRRASALRLREEL